MAKPPLWETQRFLKVALPYGTGRSACGTVALPYGTVALPYGTGEPPYGTG